MGGMALMKSMVKSHLVILSPAASVLPEPVQDKNEKGDVIPEMKFQVKLMNTPTNYQCHKCKSIGHHWIQNCSNA